LPALKASISRRVYSLMTLITSSVSARTVMTSCLVASRSNAEPRGGALGVNVTVHASPPAVS